MTICFRRNQNIHEQEMQGDVPVGEALGFPRLEKRIVVHRPAVNREEDVFPLRGLTELHILPEPAFDPPFLVVVNPTTPPQSSNSVYVIIFGISAFYIQRTQASQDLRSS